MRTNLRPRRRLIHIFGYLPDTRKRLDHQIRPGNNITHPTHNTQRRDDYRAQPPQPPLIIRHPDPVDEREHVCEEVRDEPEGGAEGYPHGTQVPEEAMEAPHRTMPMMRDWVRRRRPALDQSRERIWTSSVAEGIRYVVGVVMF
jgi:hypothetical protein